MKLLLLLLLFLPLAGFAGDGYLKARSKFYAKTIGDGLEKGIEFSFREKMLKLSLGETPLPILEITNNSAECSGDIKIDKIKSTPGRFQWVYYVGVVSAKVDGDTGGCIGLARWPEGGDILKIIDYSYITNF